MEPKPANAFITTRKGFCYLTIRSYRTNIHLMRIRNYTLDADHKRQMRRSVVFDWKKITRQLAESREVCRGYRLLTLCRGMARRFAFGGQKPTTVRRHGPGNRLVRTVIYIGLG